MCFDFLYKFVLNISHSKKKLYYIILYYIILYYIILHYIITLCVPTCFSPEEQVNTFSLMMIPCGLKHDGILSVTK